MEIVSIVTGYSATFPGIPSSLGSVFVTEYPLCQALGDVSPDVTVVDDWAQNTD